MGANSNPMNSRLPNPRIGRVNLSDLKHPEVVEAAVFAVKEYNKQKNANLQFVRVAKASVMPSCGLKYNITVEAINCGEKKTYKTEVLLDASKGGILELLEFEPSNQGNKQDFCSLSRWSVDNDD